MNWKYILATILAALLFTFCATNTQSTGKAHPEWALDATIYELNIRQFTAEGTFNEAAKHIPRLKELGVDIIWVMPIQKIGVAERKGELGSYYAIADYREVNPEFGTMDDFRSFVDLAHSNGLKVILDWVPNHTSPDAVWTENRDWYVQDSLGNFIAPYDWTDVAKLNYKNKDMRQAMVDAMIYWLEEASLDGFRCDVASEVPVSFWDRAVDELLEVNPDLFMLAEAEAPNLMDHAFDAYYAWELHHVMNLIAKGEMDADSLRAYYKRAEKRFKVGIPMNFTSNHDENSWNGTEFERMGDAVKTFAALTYVIPGMPLIYNGQEVGFDRRLEFFQKDSIDWTPNEEYTVMYEALNKMRKENAALHSGQGEMVQIVSSSPSEVFSFVREEGDNRVIALFNLSDKEISTIFDWKGNEGEYIDYMSSESCSLSNSQEIEFAPWGYQILIKSVAK